MLETESLKKQISNYQRRLQKLKERQAIEGIGADPALLIEIEDIEEILEKLQAEALKAQNNARQAGVDDTLGSLQFRRVHSERLFEILLTITALQNQDNRDLLLRNLPPGPVGTINRSSAAIPDVNNIVSTVSSWGRLENGEWALAVLAQNALSLVRGTEPGRQLEAWLFELKLSI